METSVRWSRIWVAGSTLLAVSAFFWSPLFPVVLAVPVLLAFGHWLLFRRFSWWSGRPPAEFLIGSHRGHPAFLPIRTQVWAGQAVIFFGAMVGARLGSFAADGDTIELFGALVFGLLAVAPGSTSTDARRWRCGRTASRTARS